VSAAPRSAAPHHATCRGSVDATAHRAAKTRATRRWAAAAAPRRGQGRSRIVRFAAATRRRYVSLALPCRTPQLANARYSTRTRAPFAATKGRAVPASSAVASLSGIRTAEIVRAGSGTGIAVNLAAAPQCLETIFKGRGDKKIPRDSRSVRFDST